MDPDTICQKLLLKVVLKEPHPFHFANLEYGIYERGH